MNAWDDPRIARGMEKQLAERRARIAAGEKPIGWKVGLGAKAAMERLNIRMPLVGYMMQKSLVPNGSTVSVAGWTQPVAEPEIAAYMATDLAGGASREAAIAAVGALGPAIELADLNPPPADVEVALAGNIFHRNVILGAPDKARAGDGRAIRAPSRQEPWPRRPSTRSGRHTPRGSRSRTRRCPRASPGRAPDGGHRRGPTRVRACAPPS